MTKWTICVCLILLTSCFYQDSENMHSKANSGWTRDSTIHFRLHAQKGVRSEKSLKTIGEKMEGIQQKLLAILEESKLQKLDIYFLKDRETLTSYTGFPANGYTNTQKGIIYFVDKDPFHLALQHEIMHALSWRLWGTPKGYWISEGIAVFASGSCGGYNLHALAHAMQEEKKLVSYVKLTNNFDFRSLEPSLQSASMVKYIYDAYGISTLKAFWEKGWQSAQKIIDISSAELEQRWRIHIQQEKYKMKIDWEKLKKSGCE